VGNLAHASNISVLGEATNLASRLQATSRAGEVTLSGEAHRRVGDWLHEQGMSSEPIDLELKGFAQPVTAYRVAVSSVAAQPA
jgi:class 3 adenylate cyclase